MKKRLKVLINSRMFVRTNLFMMVSFLMTILLFVAAVMIFTYRKSIDDSLNYNYSAVQGIGSYIDSRQDMIMDLLSTVYEYSGTGEKQDVFAYLENSTEKMQTPDKEILFQKQYMLSYVSSIFYNDSSVTACAIYAPNAGEIYNLYGLKKPSYSANAECFALPRNSYKNGDQIRRIEIRPSALEEETGEKSYCMIYPIASLSSWASIGAIEIDFSNQKITEYIHQYYPGKTGEFLIVNQDNQIIYSSLDSFYEADPAEISQFVNSDFTDRNASWKNKNYYTNFYENKERSVRIIGLVSEQEILLGIGSVFFPCVLIAISVWLAVGLLSYLNTRTSAKKLAKMKLAMGEVKNGNFHSYIVADEKHKDELYDIAICYNQMLDDLNQYIDKVYNSELEKNRFLMLALQAQINPHFLFNSFEAIRMKAVCNGQDEIAEMVYILSKIFYNASKGSGTLPIETELENCRYYLKLHQIRFKDQLQYEIDVDEEIYTYTIVQYALQVSIENYIFHGFDNERNDNFIKITGRKIGDKIVFVIEDNGMGMSPENLSELKESLLQFDVTQRKSIGLANVSKRLQVVFGTDSELDVENNTPCGFRVTMSFRAVQHL